MLVDRDIAALISLFHFSNHQPFEIKQNVIVDFLVSIKWSFMLQSIIDCRGGWCIYVRFQTLIPRSLYRNRVAGASKA